MAVFGYNFLEDTRKDKNREKQHCGEEKHKSNPNTIFLLAVGDI
jgi:hypothetical protein